MRMSAIRATANKQLSRSGPDSVERQLSDGELVIRLVRSLVVVEGLLDPDALPDVVGDAPEEENVEGPG